MDAGAIAGGGIGVTGDGGWAGGDAGADWASAVAPLAHDIARQSIAARQTVAAMAHPLGHKPGHHSRAAVSGEAQ
jgi:hypothetical protein